MPAPPKWNYDEHASWTFDQALEEQERAAADGKDWADPDGPLWQWIGLQELKAARASYDSGDKLALLRAVSLCAQHSLVMPDWLAVQFLARYRKVTRVRVGSWDEAFGRPFKKGTHISQARLRLEKRFLVHNRIRTLHADGRSINEDLFDEVATELGVSRTVCKELWAEAQGLLDRILPDRPTKRRPGKRKNSRRY